MNWGEIFSLSVPPLELMVRGTAMYLFLFLLFRIEFGVRAKTRNART